MTNLQSLKPKYLLEIMVTEITEGVQVSILAEFHEEYSNPLQKHFVFTYKVYIENHSPYTLQLLRRRWHIFDSNFTRFKVEGEGVIGEQPILESGDSHHYTSGCSLKTDMGKMRGAYIMKRLSDNAEFEVVIPDFKLIAPFRLN